MVTSLRRLAGISRPAEGLCIACGLAKQGPSGKLLPAICTSSTMRPFPTWQKQPVGGGLAAHVALVRGWLGRRRSLDLIGATNLIPGPNSTERRCAAGRQCGAFLRRGSALSCPRWRQRSCWPGPTSATAGCAGAPACDGRGAGGCAGQLLPARAWKPGRRPSPHRGGAPADGDGHPGKLAGRPHCAGQRGAALLPARRLTPLGPGGHLLQLRVFLAYLQALLVFRISGKFT